MRSYIALVENVMGIIPKPTPALVAQVRSRLKAGNWYGDYEVPDDEEEFLDEIGSALFNIGANTSAQDGGLVIWRAEQRPGAILRQKFVGQTVGVFWSYRRDNARAVYGPTHGPEIHGARTVEVVFEAVAAPAAINWPATIAANLALPQEREITLNQDAEILVRTITAVKAKREIVVHALATVDNLTQYDDGAY